VGQVLITSKWSPVQRSQQESLRFARAFRVSIFLSVRSRLAELVPDPTATNILNHPNWNNPELNDFERVHTMFASYRRRIAAVSRTCSRVVTERSGGHLCRI
jgi:hypothetical protein